MGGSCGATGALPLAPFGVSPSSGPAHPWCPQPHSSRTGLSEHPQHPKGTIPGWGIAKGPCLPVKSPPHCPMKGEFIPTPLQHPQLRVLKPRGWCRVLYVASGGSLLLGRELQAQPSPEEQGAECGSPEDTWCPQGRRPHLTVIPQAAGEGHRAALAAGVGGGAVEVHVLRPVLVGDTPAATELWGRGWGAQCGPWSRGKGVTGWCDNRTQDRGLHDQRATAISTLPLFLSPTRASPQTSNPGGATQHPQPGGPHGFKARPKIPQA